MATGALGIVFAGVAAVAVQIFSTTRGASGFAAAVLGLAFVVSGVGNMLGQADASGLRLESAWPAWLSALGWGQQMRPFGGDSWWPLGLFLIAFIVLAGAAACSRQGATSEAASSRSGADKRRHRRGSSARLGSSGSCNGMRCSDGPWQWPDSGSSSARSSTR